MSTDANRVLLIGDDVDNGKTFETEMIQNGQCLFDQEESNANVCSDWVNNSVDTGTKWTIWSHPISNIKWLNVLWLLMLHSAFLSSFVYLFQTPILFYTVVWSILTSVFSGFGMSVGAHRLWAHQTFKAKWLLRLFLLILQTMTINGSALSYARDHRNHHKWPATHADPKNPARGFFFAHIGWWMLRKRPEVLTFGNKVPIEDLLADRMLMLQHQYYIPLVLFWSFIVPIGVPVFVWNENPFVSLATCIIRIVVVLHHLFTVNSVAHFWGYRPYNRFMKPTENHFINWISMGEGNHNYHHTFPFDYCNSQFQWWEVYNPATLFIEVCILLRLASNPKKPSPSLIHKVIEHKGKPEYFVKIQQRSLCSQIVLGMIDWILGLFFAQWSIWVIMFYKIFRGLPLFVF